MARSAVMAAPVLVPVFPPVWSKLSASVISLPPERVTVEVAPSQATLLPIRLPMARMGR